MLLLLACVQAKREKQPKILLIRSDKNNYYQLLLSANPFGCSLGFFLDFYNSQPFKGIFIMAYI